MLHNGEFLLMIPLGVDLLNVSVVEENLTREGVVETLNEGDDGRLSAA